MRQVKPNKSKNFNNNRRTKSTTQLPNAVKDIIEAKEDNNKGDGRKFKKFVNKISLRKLARKEKRKPKLITNNKDKRSSNVAQDKNVVEKDEKVKEVVKVKVPEKVIEKEKEKEKVKEKKVKRKEPMLTKVEIEEERYLKSLEKKLKIKSSKLDKGFMEDGLFDLLEGINVGSKNLNAKLGNVDLSDNSFDEGGETDENDYEDYSDESSQTGAQEPELFEGAHYYSTRVKPSEEVNEQSEPKRYVPPQLRNSSMKEDSRVIEIRRKLQNLSNKLNDTNIESSLMEIDSLYLNYPRLLVTEAITNLILNIHQDNGLLLNSLIILNGSLVAGTYRLSGTEAAAHFVQKLVEIIFAKYNELKSAASETRNTKPLVNLVSLLARLYNLEVIACTLIYDFIKMLLDDGDDVATELLLKLLKAIGMTLRQDDPSAMKVIVQQAQGWLSKPDVSLKFKFMVELLVDIKNNKVKSSLQHELDQDDDLIKKMKLTLKSVSKRKGSSNHAEPLRVSLQDILQVGTKGKWWLVGAAFKGHDLSAESQVTNDTGDNSNQLLLKAKEQAMNTDLRKSIFTALMSGEDYVDGYQKLLKLNLNERQARDIPRIIVQCCGNEPLFNPYYALVAVKLCHYKVAYTVTFQYCLWDLFRDLGETNIGSFNTAQSQENQVPLRKLINLAKLYGKLLADNGLAFTVLKTLTFSNLSLKTKMLLKLIFTNYFLNLSQHSDFKDRLQTQMTKLERLESVVLSLKYFLKVELKPGKLAKLNFKPQELESITKVMDSFVEKLESLKF